MNMSQKILGSIAAAALTAAPAAAEVSRTTAPSQDAEDLSGGMEGGAWIAILGVIAVVVLAIVAATDGDDDSVSA